MDGQSSNGGEFTHRPRITPKMIAFTRKNVRHCICGGAGYYRVDARPGQPWFGVAMPCLCKIDEKVKAQMDRLMSKSHMTPQEMARWTFATFYPEQARVMEGHSTDEVAAIWAACKAYAKKPRGNIILTGPWGSGKSHLAYAIAGWCVQRGMSVYAANVADMLDMLRDAMKHDRLDEWLQDLEQMDLLVIDDLGVQKDTDWALEKMFQIVDYRYRQRLPLVITTNLDVATARSESRLLSRLCEGCEVAGGASRVMGMPCGDFRPGKVGR